MTAYVKRIRDIWMHPGNSGARTAAVLRSLRWRAQLVRTDGPRGVPVFGGLTFLTGDDHTSRAITYFGPWFEYDEMKFVSRYLRPGDSVLDVGANAGVYSLLASTCVGPSGHIDAIEPIPDTASRLAENVRVNRLENVVRVHNVAVGEREGKVAMTSSRDSTNHVVDEGTGTRVPCARLDALMGARSYAFAKLDVEGMELPALKGASEHFASGNPPVWMIEINGGLFRYGLTVPDVIDWIHARDYDFATYDDARRAMTVTTHPWGNVFLVKRDAWAQVQERIPELTVDPPHGGAAR